MRRTLCFIMMAALAGIASAGEAWEGRCVGVLGGDAIEVVRDGRTFDVRVYGVDCPKRGQDFFLEAARNTHRLVYERMVTVEPVTADAEGRIVGLVTVDGVPLTNRIIEDGLGTVSREYCRGARMCLDWRKLEAEAARDKRGIWAGAAPPGGWSSRVGRIEAKADKVRGEVKRARDSVSGKRESLPPPPPPRPASGFVGTPKTKRLHKITCRNAKVPDREFFPTVNAGLDAGYSLCRLCEPVP